MTAPALISAAASPRPLRSPAAPMARTAVPDRAPRAAGGLYVCDTELIPGPLSFERSRPCEAIPAFLFAAVCSCGHPIGGWACANCLDSAGRGCLTCWRKPGRWRRRHACEVVLYAPGRPP